MYYGFDYTYVFVLIAVLISYWASSRVTNVFNKYKNLKSSSAITGSQLARFILDSNGLQHIKIEHISGNLTDHYDPSSKTVRLSDCVYSSMSIAAIGVAAHECGHAVQDKEKYSPLIWRSSLVPVVNICSRIGIPVIILGLIIGLTGISKLGIILFSSGVVFHLVTLPVEFDASSRALAALKQYKILNQDEVQKCREVLSSAAFTYVASAVGSILQLLRLVLINRSNSRRIDH